VNVLSVTLPEKKLNLRSKNVKVFMPRTTIEIGGICMDKSNIRKFINKTIKGESI